MVAGVGVGGGVSAYLGAKTKTIATLKTLGADSATIRAIYLWQIGLVALGAVAIGLALGAATPWLVAAIRRRQPAGAAVAQTAMGGAGDRRRAMAC